MNILLPKMVVVENTEESVVSQYDRLAGGNPGFNLDAPEWDFELTMVNPDSLKLVNTRAEMFKLSDNLNFILITPFNMFNLPYKYIVPHICCDCPLFF